MTTTAYEMVGKDMPDIPNNISRHISLRSAACKKRAHTALCGWLDPIPALLALICVISLHRYDSTLRDRDWRSEGEERLPEGVEQEDQGQVARLGGALCLGFRVNENA